MSKEVFVCPYCDRVMSVTDEIKTVTPIPLAREHTYIANTVTTAKNAGTVYTWICLECNEITVKFNGDFWTPFRYKDIQIVPDKKATETKNIPSYIPKSIADDYSEAHSILELSPKASATLSRRCLQTMIRDFWDVKDKRNLYQEIDAIRDKVSPAQWEAMSALRSLGNIGAHMEKDVNMIVDIDSREAEQLLSLIEILIESWYIRRHDEQQLYSEIVAINSKKQELKDQARED